MEGAYESTELWWYPIKELTQGVFAHSHLESDLTLIFFNK